MEPPLNMAEASKLLGCSERLLRDLIKRFPGTHARAAGGSRGKILFYPKHIEALRRAQECRSEPRKSVRAVGKSTGLLKVNEFDDALALVANSKQTRPRTGSRAKSDAS